MEQKIYRVQFGSRIAGSADSVVVIAQSEDEAMEIAKPLIEELEVQHGIDHSDDDACS